MFLWICCLVPVRLQSTAAQPSHIFVSAPNIIRAGNIETVLVSVFDTEEVPVTVTLKNGDGSNICPPVLVQVNPDNPQIVSLYVDPENVPQVETEEDLEVYAKLGVTCSPLNNFQEEKDVLIRYEEGFLFIQTDKPIYTPDQRVNIRLLVLDQYLRPSSEPVQLDVLSPQGVIVHRSADIQARHGFKTRVFSLPHEPLLGNWSVLAHYGKELKSNRSVQFEVKEYVLPTFEVKLTTPGYILDGQEAVDITVSARYVYDILVLGVFYAKVGVLGFDGEIDIKVNKSGQWLENGLGHFRINMEDLGENWFAESEGRRLYVEVSVLESASGRSGNVSDISTKFVQSPYQFKLDRTVRWFKKGLPYEVKVDLTYPNGKAASRVRVEMSAKGIINNGQEQVLFGEQRQNREHLPMLSVTNNRGQVNFRIYVPSDCQSIQIQLQTQDHWLIYADGANHNADFQFEVQPYVSPTTSDFLLIRLTQELVTVNSDLYVEALVETNDVAPHLAYYVMTKGRIVHAGLVNSPIDNLHGFRIPVSYDMVPSVRIVAYYINQHGHVIADSLWIEIQKVCENHVSVSVMGRQSTDVFRPDETIELIVESFPSTTVGLLAVDKAVSLLRDSNRLTKDKMYQTMDTYDTGSGPGGGRDSPDVFKQAGIVVLSNANLEIDRGEAYGCATPLNQRRRMSTQEQLASHRHDDRQYFACSRGQKLLVADMSCAERSNRFVNLLRRKYQEDGITDERVEELIAIFMICCRGAEEARNDRWNSGVGNPFDNPDRIEDRPEDVAFRSDFRETWLFEEVEIGDNGFARQQFTIPSSISAWYISAVGLSEQYAMCVARPLEILVRKELLIQLHTPYSVIRKEQVEIVATIFNYSPHDQQVRVFLHTTEKICSEGNPNEYSAEKRIEVTRNNAVNITYVVIGLEVGEHPITVAAVYLGTSDADEKILRVVPEGIERSFVSSTTLDPTGSLNQQLEEGQQERASISDVVVSEVIQAEESRQYNFFDVRLPSGAVPGSERCEVSIIGSVLGPVITAVIDGLESLLALPRGCGEQTMIYLAPNVYVLRYLTRVDQSTESLEAKATHNIEEGITREMTHRHADGSFSIWGTNPNYPSSTWLTAFVNKVFCHASEFAFVDNNVTCKAIEWLIDFAQRWDGAFVETYRVHNREMTGGVQGDATLTAFVLISIHECECVTLTDRIANSTSRAKAFLEGELRNLNRPYAVAIVTYALALVQSDERHRANLRLKSMDTYDEENGLRYWTADASSLSDSSKPYWYRVRPSAISVETTGYALLAQLALGDVAYSHSIVKWLSKQQNYGGGFASTQDTIIALQALSEYAVLIDAGEIDMHVFIEQGDDYREDFHFTRENALVQRHATPPVKGTLMVRSEGRGTGKLNVKVTYNTISEDVSERPCAFTIDINAREALAKDEEDPPEEPPNAQHCTCCDLQNIWSTVGRLRRQAQRDKGRDALMLNVRVVVAYMKNEPTNMAIIDVGIYSGFEPIKEDLEQIVEDNDYISRFEISQRSVIFYADFIPTQSQEPELEIQFNVKRKHTVGNIKPVAVKVYDYYNPTEECVKFYHPASVDARDSLLDYICEGSFCLCAEGDCAATDSKPKDELLRLSCENAATYAYQISIMDSQNDNSFKVYTATITQVLKIANDEVFGEEVRQFWVSSSCSSVRIKNQESYLVIGQTVLPYADTDGNNSFKYIIDAATTIELWPLRNRKRKRIREQFLKMQEFKEDMLHGNNNCQ
ncbi:complement C3-like [Apostichopus japonicus]|uniref:complement C3-like n=1 Tax=Stichopus japonicus TaxID=307972 RepID=UPI003AB75333